MGVDSRPAIFADSPGRVGSMVKTFDFEKEPLASTDILKMFPAPKGTKGLYVRTKILVPEGEAATADIGAFGSDDNGELDADGFHNDVDLNAAAGTEKGGGGAYTIIGGKFHEEDAWIGLTPSTTLNLAKIEVEYFFVY